MGAKVETPSSVLLVVLLTSFVSLTNAQQSGPMPPQKIDCSLALNYLWYEKEPTGNPLLIHVRIIILHIRDIPDRGGSFGVDIKYDIGLNQAIYT